MDIDDWIEEQREQGRTEAQIRSSMESAGWDQETIDQKLGTEEPGEDAPGPASIPDIRDLLPEDLPVDTRTLVGGLLVVGLILLAAYLLPSLLGGGSVSGAPPIAYYPFDDMKEFSIAGAGDSPSLTRDPQDHAVAPGINGSAILFTGPTPLQTGVASVGGQGQVLSRDALSVSMWVRPFFSARQEASIPGLFSQGDPSRADWLTLRGGLAEHRVRATIGTASPPGQQNMTQLSTSYTLPPDTWSHVALTYHEGTASIYINGIKRAEQAKTPDFLGLTDGWSIGSPVNGTGFTGRIDDLRVYDYALSADQVQAQYAALSGPDTG